MSNSLPPAITAGVTFSHVFTLTAFPAPDWQLKLLLRGPQVIDPNLIPLIAKSREAAANDGYIKQFLKICRAQVVGSTGIALRANSKRP